MSEEMDLETRRALLRQVWFSPIGRYYKKRLLDEKLKAIEDFIALPPEKKPSKAAFDMAGRYNTYKKEGRCNV